jgi:hypothetical protein
MKTVLTLMMVVLISITGITSLRLFIYDHWTVSALLTLVVVVSIILCIDLLTNTEDAPENYSLQ